MSGSVHGANARPDGRERLGTAYAGAYPILTNTGDEPRRSIATAIDTFERHRPPLDVSLARRIAMLPVGCWRFTAFIRVRYFPA